MAPVEVEVAQVEVGVGPSGGGGGPSDWGLQGHYGLQVTITSYLNYHANYCQHYWLLQGDSFTGSALKV